VSGIGPRNSLIYTRFEPLWPRNVRTCSSGLALMAALLVVGCQGVQPAAFQNGSEAAGVSGAVYGGQQPISGASIQLYAAGAGGDGSAATPLLTWSVFTDNSGSFNLTGVYACPTAATEVYLVAIGGNPGLMNGGTNAQIALVTALGPCGNLTASTSVEVNEVTTVAAAYALAPYMKSYSEVGSNASDAQMMADAFTMAAELASTGTGSTPGVGVPTGQVVPSQKLNTLASIVAACINSDGGKAGDSSSCGQLFSLASAASSDAPTDTVGALLDIAQNPTSNVVPIFDLDPPAGPFQPSLSSAPADWTLAITSTTPSPVFSPSPGTYAASPSVTLFDSNLSAAIYYTTDGSQPTSSSIPYTGAIALSGTTTIRAVAIASGISSLLAAGTYALAAPTIALTPGSVTLTSSQTQVFSATISGSSNTAVTWSLSPAVGSISSAGVYTAPALIAGPQTVTVSATSVADSSVAASSSVLLVPPVSVALTPGTVTLTPSQTQAFTAAVANTSNTAVTWSLNPAVGSISAGGLYTAPASITSAQTVTVTATSVADPTKSASSGVTIVPLVGATFYLAPASLGGSDSNNGLSPGVPWLTPNHALNCGDVIIAAPSTAYSSYNFWYARWGTVNCPAGNNVAWLKCATAFACAINTSDPTYHYAMFVSASYWGVQGWVFSSTTSACVEITPGSNIIPQPPEIHHIVIANNVINGCAAGGIASNNGSATAGTDYLAYVGNIVYGTGSSGCFAGLSFNSPIPSDTLPGTHMYMGGNFSWGNTDNCGDGEGIIFDTFDGVSTGVSSSYTQQAVAENNLLIYNAGPGLQADQNSYGTGPWAPIYFTHNTVAYNNVGPSIDTDCGEIELSTTVTTQVTMNLVDAPSQYCYGGSSITQYGEIVAGYATSTNHIYSDFIYSSYGNAIDTTNNPGFVAGPGNVTGTNPSFANPVKPGAPNCSGYATTTACMATVIANFTPTNMAAVSYGYQVPSSAPVNDPLFPQWLCNVNLPIGLVTLGCM
jgi:hypothetical protein